MAKRIKYFGYGTMANERIMTVLIGRVPEGSPAILYGYALHVQHLDQIPDDVHPGTGLSPRVLLREKWGERFRNYTILPDENATVHGMLWDITDDEQRIIRAWELVDAGWHEEVAVTVAGELAISVRIRDGQKVHHRYESMQKPRLLNDLEKTVLIATNFRYEFEHGRKR